MRKFLATVVSTTPYSQGKFHDTPRLDKESPDEYEKRTWMERLHTDETGNVFIPPMAFKNCLSESAKFLSMKIPGQRNATYTKHFEAGVMVLKDIPIGVKKKDVKAEWLFVPSDGVRGGGKRVKKCFPKIDNWKAIVEFTVVDDTITKEVFTKHLQEAGNLIGIGRFRPRNNGYYGRFDVTKVEVKEGK